MSDEVPAAYIVGIMNSSPVQAIADGVPPGMMRQEDLADLGLPIFDAERVRAIADETMTLAGLVLDLVSLGRTWPSLRESLRQRGATAEEVESAWVPPRGPAARWGSLRDLAWVELEASGSLGVPILDAEIERGIFGTAVVASNGTRLVRLRLTAPDDDVTSALLAYVRGLKAAGQQLMDIAGASAPVNAAALVARRRVDLEGLQALFRTYGEARARIDSLVAEVL